MKNASEVCFLFWRCALHCCQRSAGGREYAGANGAARATETQDSETWGDKADTSWYVHETESEYHITTAEQLAGLAKLINDDMANFKDKTIYLENDLDLGGHEWISIGDGANTDVGSFQGVF